MRRDLERRPFEMKRDLGQGFEKMPIKETCINDRDLEKRPLNMKPDCACVHKPRFKKKDSKRDIYL